MSIDSDFSGICWPPAPAGGREHSEGWERHSSEISLGKDKDNSFVVTLAGATDVSRREQILSQQCQEIDQHIFEVADNLKIQT